MSVWRGATNSEHHRDYGSPLESWCEYCERECLSDQTCSCCTTYLVGAITRVREASAPENALTVIMASGMPREAVDRQAILRALDGGAGD